MRRLQGGNTKHSMIAREPVAENTSASNSPLCGHDRVRVVIQGILRGAQASGWTDEALAEASGGIHVSRRTEKPMTIKPLHGLRLTGAFDRQGKLEGRHDAYYYGGGRRNGAWSLR